MTVQSVLNRVLATGDMSLWVADPMFFTLIWIAIMLLIIICPFIATRERRRLCRRRITERTWNIEGVELPSILPHSRVIERSYPIGDPRRRFTIEDADNETKKFIHEKLAPFTKIIDKNDFIENKDDIEMGEREQSLAKNQSSKDQTTDENAKSPITPTYANDVVDQESILENKDDLVSTENESGEENPSVENHNDVTGKHGIIKLPGPGIPLQSLGDCSSCTNSALNDVERRCSSTECSICLTAFSVGDEVSWSALDCDHVFHQECIAEWLMTLGKKNNRIAENSSNNTILQMRLCNYNMVCPVCRKDFIPNAKSSG